MTKVLVIGGPAHGKELDRAGKVTQVMHMHPSGVAMPTNYILRDMSADFEEEGTLRKDIYVHESIASPSELMQLLASYLIGEWIRKDGVRVIEEAPPGNTHTMVLGGPGAGAQAVGQESPRAASGLYLP